MMPQSEAILCLLGNDLRLRDALTLNTLRKVCIHTGMQDHAFGGPMHLPADRCIGVEMDAAPNALTQGAHLLNTHIECMAASGASSSHQTFEKVCQRHDAQTEHHDQGSIQAHITIYISLTYILLTSDGPRQLMAE